MADQCIVCLENLETESSGTPQLPTDVDAPPEPAVAAIEASKANGTSTDSNGQTPSQPNHDPVALIQVCGHVLHDLCLREWTEKANSCPICRQAFHLVHVYDKVGGTLLSSYKVEDKKQVAEFDQQAWLDENPEPEEEATPCPVCNRADEEEILLLCDGCDTPYHTHCIGLDSVPRGSWFCMECVDALGPQLTGNPPPAPAGASRGNGRRSDFFPRTQASMRRARHRARSDDWQGAWGQVSARVFDGAGIDLDFHDEDDALEDYRRLQQLHERERREHQRWQQRLNIASRLGARDVFASSIQNVFGQRRSPTPRAQPPVEQTPEERGAWRALEKAMEQGDDGGSSSSRKRKTRSVTGSPSEPRPEPEQERKLKRPRTRRLPTQNGNAESSSSKSTAAVPDPQPENRASGSNARSPPSNIAGPSFLSSLLKEVEMSTPSDDESIRNIWGHIPGAHDASSPAPSPSASGYSSPRALSTTPPPNRNARPTSPTLSLSSHIEPVYPPAKFSPTRSSPENSDSETTSNQRVSRLEVRHPRPRRPEQVHPPRSQDVSPSRTPLPLETKQDINNIVREALRPHWKSNLLTSAQYATINRDISHKLYEEVKSPTAIDDEVKKTWEKMASKEVDRAVSELKAGA